VRTAIRHLVLGIAGASLLVVALALPVRAQDPNSPSPTFSGERSNVWILNEHGETVGTFALRSGAWTTQVDPEGPFGALVHTDAGNVLVGRPGSSSSFPVMVNQIKQSLPRLDPLLPDLSIAGLDLWVSDPDDSSKPGVIIEPPGGAYGETIPVTIRAVRAASGSADPTVSWHINGGGFGPPKALEARFFLVRDGTYRIEARATQSGVSSDDRTVTYHLNAIDGLQRDTDGDGIPDLVEVAKGLDPLTRDHTRDRDGDGWSDLDEILRGSEPNDPNDMPGDRDGDGWSDFDEDVRRTGPDDPLDLPVARRLYEVEYILSGQILDDAGPRPNAMDNMGQLTVHDVFWNRLYDQARLPTGVPEGDLPPYLRATLVAQQLASGELPPLRLPAGESSIVRARHFDGADPDEWVAKGWLESAEDVAPSHVTASLATSDPNWDDPNDWFDAYRSYLRENLLDPNKAFDLSPRSGIGIALLEGLIAWHDDLSGEGLVLLGNAASPQPLGAVEDIKQALAEIDPNQSLDDLHAQYASMTAPGGLLEAFGTAVVDYYDNPSSFAFLDPNGARDLTTTIAAAELAQGDPDNDDLQARYISRLVATFLAVELPGLPSFVTMGRVTRAVADLLDPDADFDGDGIPNGFELSKPPASATDPRSADSDGDGMSDGIDPCPLEGGNACLLIELGLADSDGDGIIDAVDVCVNTPDPNQEDSGSQGSSEPDGIGDACRLPANILTPAGHRWIFVGQSVHFSSIVTEAPFTPGLVYLWDFDGGAANSTDANPGDVVFTTSGIFGVSLRVTDGNGAGTTFGPDTRKIFVEGLGLTLNAGGPYFGVEGQAIEMTATAAPVSGEITNYSWVFGDGQVASGNPTSKTYAQQEVYAVEVTATDSGLNTGRDTTSATISDSVPTAEFFFAPGSRNLEVDFSDDSTAYDGIVSRSWDFGDGTSSSKQNPTHAFPTAGRYSVRLSVTDGDGSADSIVHDLDVVELFLSKTDEKCVNSINKGAQKIAAAQGGANIVCIKEGAKGLLAPETIEECITSDPKGKVGKAIRKLTKKIDKDCASYDPIFPTVDPNDVAAITQRTIEKELSLIHSIFGSDLDEVIVSAETNKQGQGCQFAVAKAAQKCQDRKWKEYNTCKKNKLKGKRTTRAESAGQLQDECLGTGAGSIPDSKHKILKACVTKINATIDSKCASTGNDVLFPNCAGQDLGACIDQMIECEVCLALNELDGLTRDCDEFDDGVVNGSCP
jgi:PKD repeat protein